MNNPSQPQNLTGAEIRQRYLDFFKSKGHQIIPSASLVPENDPTVLFTTAGMQPLVPFLLGEKHPMGTRLVSAQKCLRTKDIEEVGDNRHLTFFEMLGNWSLGDYFKKEAIEWSFDFMTSKEYGLGLDPARIYVTVFAGDEDAPKDEESIQIWQKCFASVGVSALINLPIDKGGRIFTLTKESNWWGPAGETGPCGPDTEMYYDLDNSELALTLEGGMPDFDSGRLLEIWNDVFMQFNKDSEGRYHPLSQTNVDTGMGLERVTAVLQGVTTPFETDLFLPIIDSIKELTGDKLDQTSVRVIADHLRAGTFMISDGVRPSNKEGGYILRRLLRRAILHLQQSGIDWVGVLVEEIAKEYGQVYPNLQNLKSEIKTVIEQEALKFQKSLERGKAEIAKREHLNGKDAFDLYQSYGFPLELTKEYAQSKGITIDEADFEAEFLKHQNLSRTSSAGQFASGLADHSELTVAYHTATHLLHQALRQILGPEVGQKGSNITPERLRFDFSYPQKLSPEQLETVETLVNEQIKAALPVSVKEISPEEAFKEGAIGLFGHKYGNKVTVYQMGEFSKEICTGPHVQNTKQLGVFKISKEEAVSAGIRRIKAVLIKS